MAISRSTGGALSNEDSSLRVLELLKTQAPTSTASYVRTPPPRVQQYLLYPYLFIHLSPFCFAYQVELFIYMYMHISIAVLAAIFH